MSPYIQTQYQLSTIATNLNNALSNNFGWFYTLFMFAVVIIAIYIMVSPLGKKRIGGPDQKPEYSTFSWLSMLFSAGMGIGLVFWGVSEPLMHAQQLAPESTSTSALMSQSLVSSYVHWGVQPWALYALMALILAYFSFNRKAKSLVSESVTPLFSDKRKKYVRVIVDTFVIVSTVFGVATSLGLGAKQIGGGLEFIGLGLTNNFQLQLIIIVVVTILFIISAISGLQKGVKFLSNSAIITSIVLMLVILLAGPAIKVFDIFVSTLGLYLNDFFKLSLETAPFNEQLRIWLSDWKIFYWAWWLSWSPYVASFIARISKGRTFREFLLGVIAVPALFAIVWFSVFGGIALLETMNGNPTIVASLQAGGPESAIFALFSVYPHLDIILTVIGIVLIGVFFITSADSATFVLAMYADDGNPLPSKRKRVFWGILQSLVAIVLLLSGNLKTIQSVAVLASFPIIFILVFMIVSFFKAQHEDKQNQQKQYH